MILEVCTVAQFVHWLINELRVSFEFCSLHFLKVRSEQLMYQGQLKSWNDGRGFGFISSNEVKSDVFIHISSLKHMQRSPKNGDVIYFDVTKQDDGKLRATNCRIQGVAFKNKATNRRHKNNSRFLSKLILIAVILAAVFIYQKFTLSTEQVENKSLMTEPVDTWFEKSQRFSCQGKQHCSEMTSCEEAEYYLSNCPNAKIDGDHDGTPCERQWCTGW